MNMNWITILGGGLAAATTLTAGVSMSGLTTPVEPPATEAPVAETIYVEQPIIEVAPLGLPPTASPLPPRISEASPIHSPDVVHGSQLLAESVLRTTVLRNPEWRANALAARIGTVEYTNIIWATLIGIFIFQEWPDWTVYAGAALIIAGSFLLLKAKKS